MYLESGCQVGCIQKTGRRGVGAHAALFHDHIPFGKEFAEYRIPHAIRLHHEPKLRPVCGKGNEILRGLVARRRIWSPRPIPGKDLVIFVRHHVSARRVFEHPEPSLDPLDLCPIRRPGSPHLEQGIVSGVHLVEECSLGLQVSGADRGRALEEQMLEKVTGPRAPWRLVHATHWDMNHERHDRGPCPLKQEEAHAVLEHVFPYRKVTPGCDPYRSVIDDRILSRGSTRYSEG